MEIFDYTKSNLIEVCSNYDASKEYLYFKRSFKYLNNYLLELNCKSFIVESDYISKDFLDNYQNYYSSCFTDYGKKCKRIHFFSKKVSRKLLNSAILNQAKWELLFEGYLGFIVVRPLSTKVIGFSLIVTYKQLDNSKVFWALRPYKINAFGKEYTFKSLAFQEQDSVVSACATTSIWTTLSKSHYLYSTPLKSPHRITRDAGDQSKDGTRIIPNKGLTVEQICRAFFKTGIEVEVFQASNKDIGFYTMSIGRTSSKLKRKKLNKLINSEKKSVNLVSQEKKVLVELKELSKKINGENIFMSGSDIQRIVNAYALLGLPIIAVVNPYEEANAYHSMNIVGYKKNVGTTKTLSSGKINHGHEFIETLYAHDDQWGPFTRIELNHTYKYDIDTIWSSNELNDLGGRKRFSKIVSLIVPLYKKVRIDLNHFSEVVSLMRHICKVLNENIVLDYYLLNSNEYKKYLRSQSNTIEDKKKILVISSSLPKYVWVITGYENKERCFDFLFDATGIASSMLGVEKVFYKKGHKYSEKMPLVVASEFSRYKRLCRISYKINDKYLKFIMENKSIYLILAEDFVKNNLDQHQLELINEYGLLYCEKVLEKSDFKKSETISFLDLIPDFDPSKIDWSQVLEIVYYTYRIIGHYISLNNKNELEKSQKIEANSKVDDKIDSSKLDKEIKTKLKIEKEKIISVIEKNSENSNS